jgi:hypothetical protein
MKMETYDLSAYTLAELIDLRDRMLNQVAFMLRESMVSDAREAKALADQCDAELKNREVKNV